MYNLAVVLQRSSRYAEAAPLFLKAMDLYEEGTEGWAKAAASIFDLLNHEDCREVPRPRSTPTRSPL